MLYSDRRAPINEGPEPISQWYQEMEALGKEVLNDVKQLVPGGDIVVKGTKYCKGSGDTHITIFLTLSDMAYAGLLNRHERVVAYDKNNPPNTLEEIQASIAATGEYRYVGAISGEEIVYQIATEHSSLLRLEMKVAPRLSGG